LGWRTSRGEASVSFHIERRSRIETTLHEPVGVVRRRGDDLDIGGVKVGPIVEGGDEDRVFAAAAVLVVEYLSSRVVVDDVVVAVGGFRTNSRLS
jgi:hypothetical protein